MVKSADRQTDGLADRDTRPEVKTAHNVSDNKLETDIYIQMERGQRE